MFQSLIGIIEDFDTSARCRSLSTTPVSIPDRDYRGFRLERELPRAKFQKFQSLIGIIEDFDSHGNPPFLVTSQFQSLIGIIEDFDGMGTRIQKLIMVSIPDRDYRGFRQKPPKEAPVITYVSIPDRDYRGFRLMEGKRKSLRGVVSIPDRDYRGFRLFLSGMAGW